MVFLQLYNCIHVHLGACSIEYLHHSTQMFLCFGRPQEA
jgi:hypothetical protein